MTSKTDHSKQLKRIKSKLAKARQVDARLKVFGADVHKYKAGKPVPLKEIREFEQEYRVFLPEDYVAFLQEIGDVRGTKLKAVAGPFYGLSSFSLGQGAVKLGEEHHLSQTPRVNPNTSDKDWLKFANEQLHPDGNWFLRGVLVLGSQGCSLYHGLILSGEFKGRIVNCDHEHLDTIKPIFSHEFCFLDWYERWLDEVISGALIRHDGYQFGYMMKGDEKFLLNAFYNAESEQAKLDALNGFSIIDAVKASTLVTLSEIFEAEEAEIKYVSLRMLTKFSSETAKPYLKDLIEGSELDCKVACESIFKYAATKSDSHAADITARLPTIHISNTYRYAMLALNKLEGDFSDHIAQGISHSNVDIRVSSIYNLSKQKLRSDLIPYFILGLRDAEHRVVHASLQALKDIKDIRLLDPYYQVATSYSWDDTYVLQNLEHRLDEIGLRSVTHFKSCYEAGTAKAQFKKYTSGNSILNILRRAFGR